MSDLGLAPLFHARDFEGTLGEYVDELYWMYRAMTEHAGLELWGRPLWGFSEEAADGRDEAFWHMITDARGPGKPRQLNLLRCAALPRVWDVLERLAEGDPRVLWWRAAGQKLIAAPLDYSLVVVLRTQPGSFRLLTTYPVGRDSAVRLRAKAEASWACGRSRRDSYRHPVWRTVRETWRAPVRRWPAELGEYA